jgi:hypothetical protein
MLNGGAVWALGTMSGTSLDGVDAAMVLTDGTRIVAFGATAYRPYSSDEQALLRAALGCWPGDPQVAAAVGVVESAHAELLSQFSGAAIVGFHGQTLAHDLRGRGTHQAGSGAALARVLAAMDLGGDGVVERVEFIEGMLRLRRLWDGQERLKRYLIPVDADGDDRLDPGEMDRLLSSIGQPPLNRLEQQAVFGPALSGLTWHAFFDRLLLT